MISRFGPLSNSELTTERRLPVVKDSSLRVRVAEILKEAIFSGALEPGESLAEIRLARELQVSQATVREALAELERYGLVVRIPNRTTMVTRFSSKEMAERVTLRICLESVACVEAASRMTGEDYEQLTRLLASLNDSMRQGDPFVRVQADLNFHNFIWERSGNSTLLRMLHELTAPLFAFACILRKRGVVKEKPLLNPHEAIIDAMKTRDRGQIETAVEGHIRPSYERFMRAAETAGWTFVSGSPQEKPYGN